MEPVDQNVKNDELVGTESAKELAPELRTLAVYAAEIIRNSDGTTTSMTDLIGKVKAEFSGHAQDTSGEVKAAVEKLGGIDQIDETLEAVSGIGTKALDNVAANIDDNDMSDDVMTRMLNSNRVHLTALERNDYQGLRQRYAGMLFVAALGDQIVIERRVDPIMRATLKSRETDYPADVLADFERRSIKDYPTVKFGYDQSEVQKTVKECIDQAKQLPIESPHAWFQGVK